MTAARPHIHPDEARRYFEALHDGKDNDQLIVVFTLPDKSTYRVATPAAAADVAIALAEAGPVEVYAGIGTQKEDLGESQRGRLEHITGLVGLVADIDIGTRGHKKPNLPPDEVTAKQILTAVGLRPTLIVRTGGGLQAHWLFREPWTFGSAGERVTAATLSQLWQETIRSKAKALGWDIDSVGDLTHVFRVPGTINNKVPDDPREVVIVSDDGPRYDPSDFEPFLIDTTIDGREFDVEDVTISSSAVPPLEKFAELYVSNIPFAAAWRRDADVGFNDKTSSGYTMSLAYWATHAGWTDQEIADLLSAWFTRHDQTNEKARRPDWFQTTIRKARKKAWENRDDGVRLHFRSDDRSETAEPPDDQPNGRCSGQSGCPVLTVAHLRIADLVRRVAERDETIRELRANAREVRRVIAHRTMTPTAKVTAIASAHIVTTAPADEEGYRRIWLKRPTFEPDGPTRSLAERTGLSADTAGKQLTKLVEMGIYTRRRIRTGDGPDQRIELIVKPKVERPTFAGILGAIADLEIESTGHGGKREKKIPTCPDCQVDGVAVAYACPKCGQMLTDDPQPDPNPEPDTPLNPQDDGLSSEWSTDLTAARCGFRESSPLFSSESIEWYTPDHVIRRVEAVLGRINLDPCSNSHVDPNVPAGQHFTREDDGLVQPWDGTVFMNPPYKRAVIDQWVAKLRAEYEAGRVTEAIALIPARTDTQWWQVLRDYPRCHIEGRLKFIPGAGNTRAGATFPSALIYLGSDPDRFAEVFGDLGQIVNMPVAAARERF